MMVFSWLLLFPIFELAYVETAYDDFMYPENTTESTVGVEAELFEHVYIKGGSVNYQSYGAVDVWQPYKVIYKFEAGIKWNGIEAGYYHECEHRVISGEDVRPFGGGMTKYFIRYGGKL